jgi:exodeoxyribonuclease-3
MLKIATWNVNSLRVRLAQVLQWLDLVKPDVLALQETKVEDKDFPIAAFQSLGFNAVYCGQKSYNGMALISRYPLQEVVTDFPGFIDPQKRFLAATVQNLRVINLYVPNGEAVNSSKYSYKLAWLEHLAHYLKQQLAQYPALLALGDFNIAPTDADVHDPMLWQDKVLASEPERQALQRVMAVGLADTFRLFEQPLQSFSWWDYRAAAFRRNLGLRIDHILANSMLAQACLSCHIDKLPRAWERPSDHTPVVAAFNIA